MRRRLGNRCDAADLSQDTFLRLLASSQRIADLQEPRAYLLTVGKRLLSNFYQRHSLERQGKSTCRSASAGRGTAGGPGHR